MRLIEKFAEIHRQVSLRSLTAVGLGVPTCFFRFEPVSIAECSAFCSETTSLFKWGYVGLPPKPAWGFTPNPSKELRSLHPLSALRLRKKSRPIKTIGRFHFFRFKKMTSHEELYIIKFASSAYWFFYIGIRLASHSDIVPALLQSQLVA